MLLTMMFLRPVLSAREPASRDENRPVPALMVTRVAVVLSGRFSLLLTKIRMKGQIMLPPAVLMKMPVTISQNWRGYAL